MTPKDAAFQIVRDELERAERKFPAPFASAHEGYAIIKEELDELWDEVKSNNGYTVAAYDEATQVAAMAVRFMLMLQERRA